tara:strand:- start:17 stop:1276 length:1260 start_codon:yes stop_codon:yes gene_type:complete
MTDYLSGERIQGSSTSIVVGDATVWDSSTGIENVTISNSNLTATSDSGSNAWDNYQAQSTVTWNPANLASGEEFQVTFKVTNDTKIGGLAFEKSPSTNIGNFGNVDFGMYMVGNGGSPNYINCMESGSSKAALGDGTGSDAYDVLDSFKMTMDSAGAVKYFRQAGSSGSFVEITGGSRDTASGDYYLYHYSYDGSYGTVITSASPTQIKQDDKSTITDVPVGTRYEETDTRKIFRRSTVPEVVTSNTYQQSNTGDTGGGFNPSYTSSSSIPNRTGLAITGAGHTLVNKKIKTVRFWIKTSGSAGNLIMKCYGSDDNVKETGSTVALSAIGSSYAYHTFNFTGGSYPTIENGDVLSIEGQASSNPSDTDISFEFSTSSDGNCDHAVWYDSAWNHQTNRETKIEVDTIVEAYDTWKEKGTA